MDWSFIVVFSFAIKFYSVISGISKWWLAISLLCLRVIFKIFIKVLFITYSNCIIVELTFSLPINQMPIYNFMEFQKRGVAINFDFEYRRLHFEVSYVFFSDSEFKVVEVSIIFFVLQLVQVHNALQLNKILAI